MVEVLYVLYDLSPCIPRNIRAKHN